MKDYKVNTLCPILMTDGSVLKVSPVTWQSKRIKCIVEIFWTVKTLSLVEVAEACVWL